MPSQINEIDNSYITDIPDRYKVVPSKSDYIHANLSVESFQNGF